MDASENIETAQTVLRLMNAPHGQWPRREDLDPRTVIIRYQDFRDEIHTWRATLICLRQGVATVMVEIRRDGEKSEIPLKLHRISEIIDADTTWPGASYFTKHLGYRFAWTTGPRDANTASLNIGKGAHAAPR